MEYFNSLSTLNDDELIYAYKCSVRFALDDEFLNYLEVEMKRRKLFIPKNSTGNI